MNGLWKTVYEISSQRHGTKMGEGHLSAHSLEVLEGLVHREGQEAMKDSIGQYMITFGILT